MLEVEKRGIDRACQLADEGRDVPSRDTEVRTVLALWFQHHLAELLALFEPALCLGRRLEWERAIDDRRQLTGEEELGCLQQLPLRAHVRAEQ